MSSKLTMLRGALPLCLFLLFSFSSFTVGTGSTFTPNKITSYVNWTFNESLKLKGLVANGQMLTYGGHSFSGTFLLDLADLNAYDLNDNVSIHGLNGFNTKKHPNCTLVLKQSKWDGYKKRHVEGTITIKGITKPIKFVLKTLNIEKENGNLSNYKAVIKIDNSSFDITNGQPTTTLTLILSGEWLSN